ncbi:MAG: hypothetical protein ACI4XF_05410 [Oscillospiraceae bacterium]
MAEKEYIDRDMYYQKINDLSKGGCGDYPLYRLAINDCMNVLDEMPAADVVEVVRCKDCRHVNDGYRNVNILLCRNFYENPVSGNDYCRWGEPKDTTSADSETVKHGHWVPTDWGFKCSACDYGYEHEGYTQFFNYCPSCGAKMDGGD